MFFFISFFLPRVVFQPDAVLYSHPSLTTNNYYRPKTHFLLFSTFTITFPLNILSPSGFGEMQLDFFFFISCHQIYILFPYSLCTVEYMEGNVEANK